MTNNLKMEAIIAFSTKFISEHGSEEMLKLWNSNSPLGNSSIIDLSKHWEYEIKDVLSDDEQHEHDLQYEPTPDDEDYKLSVTVTWDSKNEKVDKLMNKEYWPKIGDSLDMRWVEEIKNQMNWVKGDKIYVGMACIGSGYFTMCCSRGGGEEYWNLAIEANGFVRRRYNNLYNEYTDAKTEEFFTMRTSCIYNDEIAKKPPAQWALNKYNRR